MPDSAADALTNKRALWRQRAYAAPLETLNPAWASAFRDDGHWPFFERLRAEDAPRPCVALGFGPGSSQ